MFGGFLWSLGCIGWFVMSVIRVSICLSIAFMDVFSSVVKWFTSLSKSCVFSMASSRFGSCFCLSCFSVSASSYRVSIFSFRSWAIFESSSSRSIRLSHVSMISSILGGFNFYPSEASCPTASDAGYFGEL